MYIWEIYIKTRSASVIFFVSILFLSFPNNSLHSNSLHLNLTIYQFGIQKRWQNNIAAILFGIFFLLLHIEKFRLFFALSHHLCWFCRFVYYGISRFVVCTIFLFFLHQILLCFASLCVIVSCRAVVFWSGEYTNIDISFNNRKHLKTLSKVRW